MYTFNTPSLFLVRPTGLLALALILGLSLSGYSSRFFVDYSKKPHHGSLLAHELSIIHPEAIADLPALHRAGRKVLAYLSVVEIAPDASYLPEALRREFKPIGTNEVWKSPMMDTSDPAWRKYVVEELARRIFAKEFDGLFLDTADSVELLAKLYPNRAGEFRSGLASLVKDLRRTFPGKLIVMNRGLEIWQTVRDSLNGVLIESMYHTYDFKEKRYHAVPEVDSIWLKNAATKIKAAGLEVYILDYVDPADAGTAFAIARRIESDGFQAFVSTPDLFGSALAPLRRMPRRVMVLYGDDTQNPEDVVRWPSESSFSRTTQSVVEWLGYEVDYLHAMRDPLPEELAWDYAAVILDRFVGFSPSKEVDRARWLVRQKKLGKRVVFLGQVPFETKEAAPLIQEAFQFATYSGQRHIAGTLEIAATNASAHFEMAAPLKPSEHLDLRAPVSSRVYFATREAGKEDTRFDAVFTTSWGGAALDPYVVFTRPDYVDFWLVDPFAFFREALGTDPALPVPDTTTLDGARIFYTHIDGDGFRHRSAVEQGKVSGEVVLEQVLLKYPFPHTVSVIEAEIRGLVADQKDEKESERLTAVARRIFALPFVEPASHTYSHPFYWIEGDATAKLYRDQALDLKTAHQTKGIDLKREIEGSIRYIEKELCPPGKKVEIFLWSGNCKPPPEALRIAHELGVQCMNGGLTTISRKYPSLTCVGPRGVPVGDEFQVYAANDNENVYQQGNVVMRGASGSFPGGFIHLLEAFERTESPRRLKPANIYYHFYSADSPAAFRALIRSFDWAIQRDLRAITASHYARIVRDARNTAAFLDAEGAVWFANQGYLRTFRVDQPQYSPELSASPGLLGFVQGPSCVYLHADGKGLTRVMPGKGPAQGLRLAKSTAELQFTERNPKRWAFKATDHRPIKVELAGLNSGAALRVVSNGETSSVIANVSGEATLKLPSKADVQIEVQ